MHEALEPNATADITARETRAGLGLRLALALGASALTGIVGNALLLGTLPDPALRGVVSAIAAASLVGVALFLLVVRPLARSREVLNDRYQAALADALTDPLTGLGNHRAFQEELDRQVESLAALRRAGIAGDH